MTQVTAAEPGQTFHTRLTHSLKVAQFGKASAERLKRLSSEGLLTGTADQAATALDPFAVETAALAHDLGHPPFGHIAEEELDRKAAVAGGYEGNAQSFRIVTRLALQSEHPPGLNLCRGSLNGMLKYPWERGRGTEEHKWGAYGGDRRSFAWTREDSPDNQPSLEARLMDWADDVTYAVHDVDDFFRAGLIPLDRLAQGGPELVRLRSGLIETGRARDATEADALLEALEDVLSGFLLREAYSGSPDQRIALRGLGSRLIGTYVEAVSLHDPLVPGKAVLTIDADAERQVKALKALTWVYVVRRSSLAVLQHGQRIAINQLHDWYMRATERKSDRHLSPPSFAARLSSGATEEERCRLVTDLVSGLSEVSAVELFRRMGGTGSGSVTDAAARGS